jgi:hypothetical protein
MADYKMENARWTAVYQRLPQAGGKDCYLQLPFELVRYNVDTNPSATPVIVPIATEISSHTSSAANTRKIYEQVWIVDSPPWSDKHNFGNQKGA